MKKNIISMAAAMAVLSACGPGVPQLGKSSLDEVIGAMTLEEKAHLVVSLRNVPVQIFMRTGQMYQDSLLRIHVLSRILNQLRQSLTKN